MGRRAGNTGPSPMELKLKSDLDRTRRELSQLKKAGGGQTQREEPAQLRGQVTELEETRGRLSKLYFDQLEENRRRASKLHEILRAISQINADLDLDTLLSRVAATIQTSLEFGVVFIRIREPGSDRLQAAAFAGLAASACAALEAEDVKLGDFESWLSEEFRVSRSFFIHHAHPLSRRLPKGYVPELGPREAWEWHAEDVLLVPLVNGGGERIGYISVDDPADRLVPSHEVIELLEIFASHAVVAIENARLYRQLASRTAELEDLSVRMKEMNELKSNFVSTVSHELRTPLTAIRAYVDTILAAGIERLSSEQVRQFLGVLDEESLRLSRLIESVLDLSHYDSRPARPQRQTVDLQEVVEETASLLARMAEAGRVDLKVVGEAADTHVDADRDQMRQLVLHLGGNAIKFTPAGGRVVVRLTGDERSLALTVEDTGIGIPEEALEKIFDRFYQVDSSLVRRFGGTGLGLAICKSIVEGHGGRIRATSSAEQGSCFTVTVPRRAGPVIVVRPGSVQPLPSEDVLRLAVEMVSEVMNAGVVSLMLQEPNGDLVIQAAIGLEDWVVRDARVRPGSGVAGWVAQHRRPVCVARRENELESAGSGRSSYRTGTYLSVPLENENGLLGVLNVTDPHSQRAFQAEDCNLLLELAERIAHAWQRASLETNQSEVGDTADALRRVLEHLRVRRQTAPDRVSLAQTIAAEMGLEAAEIGLIGYAATVHDVGMAVVSPITEKREALTDAERREMQRHVEIGAEILRPLEIMGSLHDVVLSHHEWWDGSGYPRGLKGKDIPMGARLLAVVDAFESMTQGRAHRLPQSPEAALFEIMELRGKQFDPELVDALARVLPRWDAEAGGAIPATQPQSTLEGGR